MNISLVSPLGVLSKNMSGLTTECFILELAKTSFTKENGVFSLYKILLLDGFNLIWKAPRLNTKRLLQIPTQPKLALMVGLKPRNFQLNRQNGWTSKKSVNTVKNTKIPKNHQNRTQSRVCCAAPKTSLTVPLPTQVVHSMEVF